MSRQKNNGPETENEVTGNLVEQTELEGLTTPEVTEPKVTVAENVAEEVPKSKVKSLSTRINTVATAAVSANKKMGVYRFLSLYPQDIYIDAWLRLYYPHSFYTKDEWFMRIEELLNRPINS